MLPPRAGDRAEPSRQRRGTIIAADAEREYRCPGWVLRSCRIPRRPTLAQRAVPGLAGASTAA